MVSPLLAVSLVLNALFFAVVLLFWLQRIRIFHKVIHHIDRQAALTVFEAYPVGPDDIVFLGDSITAGGEWAEMFPDLPVRNRGISGDCTGDVLDRLAQITAGNPAKVFLLIGTNDIGLGVPRESALRAYAAILDGLAEASPETHVYVQSILPREPKTAPEVKARNAAIREMAQDRGLPYIDLVPAFAGPDGGIRDALTYDRLHLSGAGYRLWQAALAPYVVEAVVPAAAGRS